MDSDFTIKTHLPMNRGAINSRRALGIFAQNAEIWRARDYARYCGYALTPEGDSNEVYTCEIEEGPYG